MAQFPPTPPVPPLPAPPSCANCVTTNQPNGAPPQQTQSSMVRASDGKTRIDTPGQTVITNPLEQHAIILDHAKKIAQVVPMAPQVPQFPMQPPKPGAPPPPPPLALQPPPVSVQDLGKSVIEGHPVEGKRYIVQPPPLPQAPQPPKPPQIPQMQMPQMQMPQAPQAPQPPVPPPPTIAEVWTSTQLKVPVLTKVTTPSGVQTTYCKPAPTAEPSPSAFQIPPGYQVLTPKKT